MIKHAARGFPERVRLRNVQNTQLSGQKKRSFRMRKTLIALSAAVATVALTGAAQAQSRYTGPSTNPALPLAGAAVGTGVGIAAYKGFWGASSSSLATSFAGSAAGAAVAGGVAGVGTIAVIDAATQPCAGFRALFSPFIPGPSGCVNGEFVGYQQAERVNRRHYRR